MTEFVTLTVCCAGCCTYSDPANPESAISTVHRGDIFPRSAPEDEVERLVRAGLAARITVPVTTAKN